MKSVAIACVGMVLVGRAWALDPLGDLERREDRLRPHGRTVMAEPIITREEDALATALAALRLKPADITFPVRADLHDPHRRAIVERLLANPHALEGEVLGIAKTLTEAREVEPMLAEAFRIGDLPAPVHPPALRASELRAALERFCGQKPADDVSTRIALTRLDAMPERFRAALATLLNAQARAADACAEDAAKFTEPEVAFLNAQTLGGNPEGQEGETERVERLLKLVARVDRRRAAAALSEITLAAEKVLDAAAALSHDQLALVHSTRFPGKRGAFFLGGIGPDRTTVNDALVLDLGGDDVHERVGLGVGDGARRGFGSVHVILDVAGDDRYFARKASLGSGFGGVGLVWDRGGDDSYDADTCTLGAGVLGAGLLVDQAGDDTYRCDSQGEGYAMFGVGLLFDLGGADSYEARALAQGAAHAGGVALLYDRAGHDAYAIHAGGKDFRGDAFDSFGQGYAVGFRDLAAGGVGGLVDGGGNDSYAGDFWAQGVGYYYGLGFLVDRAGNDRYAAGRYAQGAGVHNALGCLLDLGGDDTYVATAVAQGTGYDESVGILHDSAGNDVYVAHDFAQGRGFANGYGLLRDDRGSDTYFCWQTDSQGFGTPHRGFGSVGVQLDLGGFDRYAPQGRNNTVLTRGDRGVLLDAPLNEGPR